MRLLSVLVIVLVLFVRGDPVCAAVQMPMAMSATECGKMTDTEDQQERDGRAMAGGCINCLFAKMTAMVLQIPLPWPEPITAELAEVSLDELRVRPPTPPPRIRPAHGISFI